jgi:hypothetical protein
MTAVFVSGRDQFQDAGLTASLGVKAFGFAWGSVGCLIIASFGFCCVACGPGRRRKADAEYSTATTSRTGRFWRKRNRSKVEADTVPTTY